MIPRSIISAAYTARSEWNVKRGSPPNPALSVISVNDRHTLRWPSAVPRLDANTKSVSVENRGPRLVLTEEPDEVFGQHDVADRTGGLRLREPAARRPLPPHMELSTLEVDVVPGKAEQFAKTQAAEIAVFTSGKYE